MNTFIASLQGKKTYLVSLLVIVLLLGQWAHWWTTPPEIYAALATLAMAFLRAGVKKEIGSLLDKAEEEEPKTEVGGQRSEVGKPGGAPRPILAMAVLVGLAIVVCSGCSTTNISEMVKALGGDTNTVSLDVSTPWGTIHATRNLPYRVQTP